MEDTVHLGCKQLSVTHTLLLLLNLEWVLTRLLGNPILVISGGWSFPSAGHVDPCMQTSPIDSQNWDSVCSPQHHSLLTCKEWRGLLGEQACPCPLPRHLEFCGAPICPPMPDGEPEVGLKSSFERLKDILHPLCVLL
jgi:hypothetical protein